MPEGDQIKALPRIGIHELRQGDLLFFSRESPLQRVFWAVNDIWLHAALVVEIDGSTCTAEVGTAPEVFSRPAQEAIDSYELTAVARTNLAPQCAAAAADWAKRQIGKPQEYAWDSFIIACLVALSRKGLPPRVLEDLGAALHQAAIEGNETPEYSRTCVGFVAEAFEHAGEACGLAIEMSDTRRLGILESAYSFSDLVDQSEEEQAAILEFTSLYDLLAADFARDEMLEGMGGSRLSRQQFGRALRTSFDIVTAFRNRETAADDDVPGLWASPTDLWRSDQIEMRARL